jgi:putative flavoprotein involved in K+ transport
MLGIDGVVRIVPEDVDVVIVGGGQAGLCSSAALSVAGREHVVLERGRVAQAWRDRWDGFHLVLPNWSVRLLGKPYDGGDPDGFMAGEEVADYLAGYSSAIAAPILEDVDATDLRADPSGSFRIDTSGGSLRAREVVLATGGYQRPHRPQAVMALAERLPVIDVGQYRNPATLPPGDVLVIGSGQSGCQIAEELHNAGRGVVLSCGRAPWQPRRIGDRDAFAWMIDTPLTEITLADLPSPLARFGANPQASGSGGGHDLNYRTLLAAGVILVGHVAEVDERRVHFAPDLGASVAFGDARYEDLRRVVARKAAAMGVPAPAMPDPPEWSADSPLSADLAGFGSAVNACGYRPDYTSWVHLDGAFDPMGFPLQEDGTSTTMPGLHFMGVHFQRNRLSASLCGVGDDARVLADHVTLAA